MKTQVILDTNFLIYSLKYKIDIKKELDRILNFQYEPCILENTIRELKFLEEKTDTRLLARIALKIVENFRIIKSTEPSVDKSLIKMASKEVIIATNDGEIKKAIKTPIIITRQKKYFELKNYEVY